MRAHVSKRVYYGSAALLYFGVLATPLCCILLCGVLCAVRDLASAFMLPFSITFPSSQVFLVGHSASSGPIRLEGTGGGADGARAINQLAALGVDSELEGTTKQETKGMPPFCVRCLVAHPASSVHSSYAVRATTSVFR